MHMILSCVWNRWVFDKHNCVHSLPWCGFEQWEIILEKIFILAFQSTVGFWYRFFSVFVFLFENRRHGYINTYVCIKCLHIFRRGKHGRTDHRNDSSVLLPALNIFHSGWKKEISRLLEVIHLLLSVLNATLIYYVFILILGLIFLIDSHHSTAIWYSAWADGWRRY